MRYRPKSLRAQRQAWICGFLSRVAKPKLLGYAMRSIHLGITDQCSQEQVGCLSPLLLPTNRICAISTSYLTLILTLTLTRTL